MLREGKNDSPRCAITVEDRLFMFCSNARLEEVTAAPSVEVGMAQEVKETQGREIMVKLPIFIQAQKGRTLTKKNEKVLKYISPG